MTERTAATGHGLAIVVGAGPGLGAAVARTWSRAGYAVGLVARTESRLIDLGRSLQADGRQALWTTADVTDAEELRSAVATLAASAGPVARLHFNPSALREENALHLSAHDLLADLGVGVAPLLTIVQAALPHLAPGARVSATGGGTADKPWPGAASLGVQKAGLRNLVTSLDSTLKKQDARAASLTVLGTLATDGDFAYHRVAAAIAAMCDRSDAEWTTEVRYPA